MVIYLWNVTRIHLARYETLQGSSCPERSTTRTKLPKSVDVVIFDNSPIFPGAGLDAAAKLTGTSCGTCFPLGTQCETFEYEKDTTLRYMAAQLW